MKPECWDRECVAWLEHDAQRLRQRGHHRMSSSIGPLQAHLRLARARVRVWVDVQAECSVGREEPKLLSPMQLHEEIVGDIVVRLRGRASAADPPLHPRLAREDGSSSMQVGRICSKRLPPRNQRGQSSMFRDV